MYDIWNILFYSAASASALKPQLPPLVAVDPSRPSAQQQERRRALCMHEQHLVYICCCKPPSQDLSHPVRSSPRCPVATAAAAGPTSDGDFRDSVSDNSGSNCNSRANTNITASENVNGTGGRRRSSSLGNSTQRTRRRKFYFVTPSALGSNGTVCTKRQKGKRELPFAPAGIVAILWNYQCR